MIRSGRLAVLALALMAVWSVWWLRHLQTAPAPEHAAAPHRIDYTMDKFEVTAMDGAGKPQYQLQAESMTHYADDDSSEFQQPRVEYIANNSTNLRLEGERGWMAAQADEIRLLGAVRIEGFAKRPFKLLTRDVSFKPDDSLAETNAPTELTSAGLRISAVGMRVYIDQQRVQLLAKVQGRYDATSH
jgi:lipopolysaccharide export system protein LptC